LLVKYSSGFFLTSKLLCSASTLFSQWRLVVCYLCSWLLFLAQAASASCSNAFLSAGCPRCDAIGQGRRFGEFVVAESRLLCSFLAPAPVDRLYNWRWIDSITERRLFARSDCFYSALFANELHEVPICPCPCETLCDASNN